MRILITCDRYPGDLSDGLTLRVFHYVRRLGTHHTFDLVCLDDVQSVEHGSDELFGKITRVPHPGKRRPPNFFARIADAFNPYTLYPISPVATEHIRNYLDANQYDLVWDAGCNMLANIASAGGRSIPLLADQVDDSFLKLKRDFAMATSLYSKLWLAKQYALLWFFSLRYLANVECVLFVSETDARSFKRHFPWAKCSVIENGVDENFFSKDFTSDTQRPSSQHAMVFEGSMFFEPNIDASIYFAREIFPLIKAGIPDARLILVGRSPPAKILALQSDSIEVTGTVADIRPYLSQARIFVCPMRMGAGIKNKILQAWSMSMAVVSTSAGVGSLQAIEGQDIIIRDDPREFAMAVSNLFHNNDQLLSLGHAGRARVLKQYTWSEKAGELQNLMRAISAKVEKNAGKQ